MLSHFLSIFAALISLPLTVSISYSNTSETYYQRNVFYAGGEYTFAPSINDTILVNQIYVEQLIPLGGRKYKYPIVFFHGYGVSGTVSRSLHTKGWANQSSNG